MPDETIETVECVRCGNDVPDGDTQYLGCVDGDVCNTCVEDHFFTCDDCDEISRASDSISTSGRRNICQSCYDDHYFTCDSCDRVIHNDDYSSDGRCESCDSGSNRTIHDYGYEIPKQFTGKGPHYFGVELEVECDGGDDSEDSMAERCLGLLNRKMSFAYAKEDSSLENGGFEIVTVPASLEEQKNHWKLFFDKMPSGLRSFNTKTCGLHVHCSRKPLSGLTVGKIVVFVNKRENQSFVEKIAGRNSGKWAIYKDKKHKDTMDGADLVRYEAVNLLNYATIEFRIFKGTLKKESVFKAIEFCDAIIKFCLPATRSIQEAQDLEKFIAFVKENRKTWPNLWGFISAKWLGEECKESKQCGYTVDEPGEK